MGKWQIVITKRFNEQDKKLDLRCKWQKYTLDPLYMSLSF